MRKRKSSLLWRLTVAAWRVFGPQKQVDISSLLLKFDQRYLQAHDNWKQLTPKQRAAVIRSENRR